MSTSNGRIPSIRVKVRRADLIAAIKAHDAQCQKDFVQAQKAYKLALSQWPAKLAAYYAEVAKQAKRDPQDVYRRAYAIRDNAPSKPSEPRKPTGAKRLIEMLELGHGDTLTLTEAQFRQYMDGCAL